MAVVFNINGFGRSVMKKNIYTFIDIGTYANMLYILTNVSIFDLKKLS